MSKQNYNSLAYFKIQIPENGCDEGVIHYIVLFLHSEKYEILIYDHETVPLTQSSFIWKTNNNLSQLSEYIYKLIIYNKMYKPEEPIYFTTNFGIKIAKVLTQELKSFLLEMLLNIQNITVGETTVGETKFKTIQDNILINCQI